MTREERIEQIVHDYKFGKITLNTALHYLEFIDWRDMYNGWRKDSAVKDIMVSKVIERMDDTPDFEYIGFEKEKEIRKLLYDIKEILGAETFNIICLYHLFELSQEEIAENVGTYKMAISRKLKKAAEKCTRFRSRAKAILENPLSNNFAYRINRKNSFTSRGFPFEIMQAVSVDGKWRGKRYITKEVCLMTDYLRKSFSDSKTKCSICFGQFEEDVKCTVEENFNKSCYKTTISGEYC